jgi:membrane protease YdiL (CAAX protease family)
VSCQRLTLNRDKTVGKLLEGAIFVLFFSTFIHFTTSESTCIWKMAVSAAMVLIAVVFARKLFVNRDSGRRLLAVLSALAGGFWVFSLFRYIGFIRWPLGHPPDLNGYLYLLYFHFVLSITVLAPVLMVWSKARPDTAVSWGNWKKTGFGSLGMTVLLLSSVGLWLFAFYEVLVVRISVSGLFMVFFFICLLKAFLTGAIEEICYRGIIQPLAIAHFGVLLGITLQSCLFTAFHMHLGEAFFPKAGFLAAVMALGLIFGAVTRLTSGIGWASAIHVAISMVIEWQNLS